MGITPTHTCRALKIRTNLPWIYLDSDILITGSNFLTSRKPTVKARAGTVEVTLNVTEWSDTYIFVSSGSDFHSTLARIPSGGFFLCRKSPRRQGN
ncbi:MAG: hypothetical protein DRG83_12865 [Deltaproteobacteria bacterium]|nr:MAG: hypothetical protein DRG83_12865 [Deltaproteobacteria bacterium]